MVRSHSRAPRGFRSAARSSAWHAEDRGFESHKLHQVSRFRLVVWVSGFHPEGRGSIPLSGTICPYSSMDRVQDYESCDLGSNPSRDANRPICWDRQGLLIPRSGVRFSDGSPNCCRLWIRVARSERVKRMFESSRQHQARLAQLVGGDTFKSCTVSVRIRGCASVNGSAA